MARNKYPEVTVNRILDASLALFLEKGYEHTTIQDIVDALGDLSKGAIYHHFKSKEDIVEAVMDRLFSGTMERVLAIRDAENMTGIEKLRALLLDSLDDPKQETMVTAAPSLMNNSRFLAQQIQEGFETVAPHCLQPILEQGIADGTIQTRYPRETAEVLTLLTNIWINPYVVASSAEEMEQKFLFLSELLDFLGVPVLDDTILQRLRKFRRMIENRRFLESRGKQDK